MPTIILCFDKLASLLKVTSITQLCIYIMLPFIRELFPWTVHQLHCNRDFQRTWCQGQVIWHTLCAKNICGFKVTLIIQTESWIYSTPPFLCSHTVSELKVWLSGCFTRKSWYPASAVDSTGGRLFIYFYIHLFATPTTCPLHLVWFPASAEAFKTANTLETMPSHLSASLDYNLTKILLDYFCPPFITLKKKQTQELCRKPSVYGNLNRTKKHFR